MRGGRVHMHRLVSCPGGAWQNRHADKDGWPSRGADAPPLARSSCCISPQSERVATHQAPSSSSRAGEQKCVCTPICVVRPAAWRFCHATTALHRVLQVVPHTLRGAPEDAVMEVVQEHEACRRSCRAGAKPRGQDHRPVRARCHRRIGTARPPDACSRVQRNACSSRTCPSTEEL